MQEWPLEQLALKCPHLEYLKIWVLRDTSPANRSLLLEFAAQAATRSSCLTTLHIEDTCAAPEEGNKFFQALADSTLQSLQHVTIKSEYAWFEEDTDGCTATLLTLLAKQTSLKSLQLRLSVVSKAMKDHFKQAVAAFATDCEVEFF